MGFAFRPRSGMTGMAMRFVQYHSRAAQTVGQLVADRLGDAHGAPFCRAAAAARKPARSSTT